MPLFIEEHIRETDSMISKIYLGNKFKCKLDNEVLKE